MSDKEFDKMFQVGFDEFAVNPSRSFWPEIEGQLKVKKKKNRFPVFWMAAASVVILLSAGLYFLRPDRTIRLYNDEAILAVVPSAKSSRNDLEEQSALKKKNRPEKVVRTTISVSAIRKENTNKVPEEKLYVAVAKDLNKIAPKIETHDDHPINQEAIVVISDQRETEKSVSLSDSTFGDTPVITNQSRIKSVGDLVNFVIGKVDRREDKIIELADNDEGTSISGINLGVLKIKSGKDKSPGQFKVRFK